MRTVIEKELCFPEALALLEKRSKEGSLGYEQQNTLVYLQEFTELTASEAKALVKDLEGLAGKTQAVALANVLPKKEDAVKAVLNSFGGQNVSVETVKEVLKLVKKYGGKK